MAETTTADTSKRKKARSSQQGGSWKTLVFLILAAVCMAIWNAYSTHRDIAIATGPADARQRAFFLDAADRPDIATLYKAMTQKQKVQVARNIAAQAATDPARCYSIYSDVAQTFELEDDAKFAKLVGVLLTDFDPVARDALTKAMCAVAAVEPGAVAFELRNGGSFQNLGVDTALQSLGNRAIPYVVDMLSNGDARPQAIEYLVGAGAPAVPALLSRLDDKDHDVQMAAVEALGKLRATEATAVLVKQYEGAKTDDKLKYLTALGSIADPSTEQILSDALSDDSLDASMKEQAALGLGRIATPKSVRRLWSFLPNPDTDFTDSTISALQLAGDASLEVPKAPPELVIRVAAAVKTPVGDAVIGDYMRSPDRALRLTALRTAARRVRLIPDLVRVLDTLNRDQDGDLIDAAVASLISTPEGRDAIQPLARDPVIAAFIKRRETINRPQG